MKFESHGRKYEVDQYGVIVQVDHRPYVYDAAYSAIYDTEAYRQQSDILQAMRMGFVHAAHGGPINSLIDIGYGNGAFINFAKQHIPYVYGHDITGVDITGALIVPDMVKADVACFWDVLEHFPEISFVRNLPYDTICISLPYCHFLTRGKDWFDNEYPHRKPDEHIRHFNEHSLRVMMDALGWRMVAVSGHEEIVRKSKHGLQNILSAAFKRK